MRTNPGVYGGFCNGVIVDIFEGDQRFGPVALVVPEFSYGSTVLEKQPNGRPIKDTRFIAHNSGFMRQDDVQRREENASCRAAGSTSDLRRALDKANPHPYAAWSVLMRLTPESHHRPKENSKLRLSIRTTVYLFDPRVKKVGELMPESKKILHGIFSKFGNLAWCSETERLTMDFGEFHWLGHLVGSPAIRQLLPLQPLPPLASTTVHLTLTTTVVRSVLSVAIKLRQRRAVV
jgi:hypothetical protein